MNLISLCSPLPSKYETNEICSLSCELQTVTVLAFFTKSLCVRLASLWIRSKTWKYTTNTVSNGAICSTWSSWFWSCGGACCSSWELRVDNLWAVAQDPLLPKLSSVTPPYPPSPHTKQPLYHHCPLLSFKPKLSI